MFRRMDIKDWRQFSEVDIDFHDHLTVLTGANGAGKTTILNLLSQSIGWEPQFVSTYGKDEKGIMKYLSGIVRHVKDYFINPQGDKLGELEYSDGTTGDFVLPSDVKSGIYNISIRRGHVEKGVYINSHRPTFPYKPIKSVTTAIATRKQIYDKYNEFNKSFIYDTFRNPNEISATSLIKETLASLAIFGYGNSSVVANKNARDLFEGYVDILKIVLPPNLGFENISVDVPEVMLRTKSGDFPIDAVSGGISSIIDITWQLYMYGDTSESFIALIDEPENHLHPELQKSFMGNLIEAFPNVQFIIATHNPFMISAVRDSNVYVLNYDDEKRVFSTKLDYVNRAGTSNEILREVLGMDSSMPFWAEDLLKRIIKKYLEKDFSTETLSELRKEMNEIGLGYYIPNAISEIAEGKEK